MSLPQKDILILYDNRELTNGEVSPFVGRRPYGDIIFRRHKLEDRMREALPDWARGRFRTLNSPEDLELARREIEHSADRVSVLLLCSRGGIGDMEKWSHLVERLPYAEENFSDRRFKPLLCYFRRADTLLRAWDDLVQGPIHSWNDSRNDYEKLDTIEPMDLGDVHDFLGFIAGSTEARHFNSMDISDYYYCKSSSDKRKMLAEYQYYYLIPEKMQSWMVQPFNYRESADTASYQMMRYYLADAALQWVHGSFQPNSFASFIDRLLFFIREREVRKCDKDVSLAYAQDLFIGKLKSRFEALMQMHEGEKVNALVTGANPELEVGRQIERLQDLYSKYKSRFATDHLAVGHGDPCFSNTLYDQQRFILKLIDPRGATEESDIWTHPFYDLSKISHSVLGDYDFINNGLFDLRLDDRNNLSLTLQSDDRSEYKQIFLRKLTDQGYDWRLIRLGEASLFLSMLPLHMDYPRKVAAFILISKKILDEIEYG